MSACKECGQLERFRGKLRFTLQGRALRGNATSAANALVALNLSLSKRNFRYLLNGSNPAFESRLCGVSVFRRHCRDDILDGLVRYTDEISDRGNQSTRRQIGGDVVGDGVLCVDWDLTQHPCQIGLHTYEQAYNSPGRY